jgi:DNA-binding CsgD family transcriptional regulator
MLARDFAGAIAAGRTAIELADRFPDSNALSRALNAVGSAQWFVEPDEAPATMRRCLGVARGAGDDVATAGALGNLGSGAGEVRRYAVADHWLREAIAFAAEHDLDAYRLYSLAWLARTQFEQGNWSAATDLVTETIGRWPAGPGAPVPDTTRVPNADRVALTVLGRLRVRRGDPGPDMPLARAWELAVQTGDLQRLWPVAAARAERAWLAGRPEEVAPLVADSIDLATRLGHPWAVGELAYWLWRVGALADPPPGAAEPYAAQIAGEPERAARLWADLGCPYEAAIALAETDEPEQILRALEQLNRLGAWPAAEQLSQRLRQLGVRGLPRRPRRATLEHPARLTAREIEILDLLPAGLRNVDIAARLHISPKTVDHHVSAILAKLGVASRREAAEWASRQAETGERPGGK